MQRAATIVPLAVVVEEEEEEEVMRSNGKCVPEACLCRKENAKMVAAAVTVVEKE